MATLLLLLLLTALVSMYDFRTRRIPNWITLPLIGVGLLSRLLLHTPWSDTFWLGLVTAFIIFSTDFGIGAGDAKLWLALLWCVPVHPYTTAIVLFAVLFATGLFQLLWRAATKQQVQGVRSPGAWRSVFFMLALIVWSLSPWSSQTITLFI